MLPAVSDPIGNVDGRPSVILEAMACRKPVISTDISDIFIVVMDGEIRLLLGEKNVDALATAIILMSENPVNEISLAKRYNNASIRN